MTHVVVTGANGFVGSALCRALMARGHTVTGLVRNVGSAPDGVMEWVHAPRDFAGVAQAWPRDLRPDCVIHLAARVHVTHDEAADPDAAFRTTNVDGTLAVADAASRNGVRRFVFLSSIKSVAEVDGGSPLVEDAPACPGDPYGRSKRDAERALAHVREQTGLDVVIVRPPLVYGPDVRANFLRLMDAVWRGAPLPLGSATGRRSLVYVGNLVDALIRCATDVRAANGCFHVCDGEDLAVAELIERIGLYLQRRARLVPVPAALLRMAGRLTGRQAQISRLTDDLRMDAAHIRACLDWRPPYSLDEGLAATAQWYRSIQGVPNRGGVVRAG
ncbi:UDP-glucose 4-epimerase family protein [Paraburkholderia caballeronis]|uniref:UDP-glucose 4-epimerase n=1 Tax=Paraburkholderia caballeronis TaxID=416943 RepID=A0A1H7R5B5_9BURK|nr:SDR family oxidoreductase [Paraburkholderia caballeronis]PXW23661.1 UDP-glucose 4-epimerase [Paraburkholderia caballeronis]PXW99002.1 UDP-glucose 4-epimerase [Paraburkholderia caballeronis]RAJ96208.1 UDP-glucose 4-epimerase [Paraburkholderia caballeronis]SEC82324.1 UDP-glucose 4-epimerase [Paraburkholderia caballeronis]SEL55125.1 UDP-glucose 4-epimerase [Paraburkholderia caballeronis]